MARMACKADDVNQWNEHCFIQMIYSILFLFKKKLFRLEPLFLGAKKNTGAV